MTTPSSHMRRVTLRMHPEVHERGQFWASRQSLSFNDYVMEAIGEKIARDSGELPDVDTLMDHRFNQLIDAVKSMDSTLSNLEQVNVSGFDSLVRLTRGDNYLLAEEDGELHG